MDLVACLERHVRPVSYFVSLRMQLLVLHRIGEILRIRNILWYIRDKAHVLDVIVNKVVIFGAILSPDRTQTFDYDMIVHVGLNFHRFTAICKYIILHDELNIVILQLVQTIPKLRVKHLLTVLLEEVEVSVVAAEEDCPVDLEEVLQHFSLVHLLTSEYLLSHEARSNLVEWSPVDEPWQVDAHRVPLVRWRILGHVIR